MNITISDNWIREFLETPAKPNEIAKYVSLCGPSIERFQKINDDTVYHIEITTNRIDTFSVYGFAREVSAILPRFKIPAKLKPYEINKNPKIEEDLNFTIIGNDKLVKRTMGVVLTDIQNWETPSWMEKRLISSGLRSLNAVVDITNYVMLEVGHPTHAFDYDRISSKKFIIRESKKGETITTFDGKTYQLKGGDIVFDDGDGNIVDLPGIIGTQNSVVTNNTKRVFFFIDNNNPAKIRSTSMSLAIRTLAASINEKGVDPELGEIAIYKGIELFQKICKAKVSSRIFDNYSNPYKERSVRISKNFIDQSLGVKLNKEEISKYLTSLEFKPLWQKDYLLVKIPSFRALDITIPEDLVEEIARIYGYHNLPSKLMSGDLPDPLYKSRFKFEYTVKNIIRAFGGVEIYTLSLVPFNFTDQKALKLTNPLGKETEYLRTSLRLSLIEAYYENKNTTEEFHLFEMANVYLPKNNNLPDEKMQIAGIFCNYNYRKAKGIIESVLKELNIDATFTQKDNKYFQPSKGLMIKNKNDCLGILGILENPELIYYEFDIEKLYKYYKPYTSFKSISKYPPQIEDLTLILPDRTKVGELVQSIKSFNRIISEVEIKDIYQNAYTFRIKYQDPHKTLNDEEIKNLRIKLLHFLKEKYAAILKE